jgi:hypothetical protein
VAESSTTIAGITATDEMTDARSVARITETIAINAR